MNSLFTDLLKKAGLTRAALGRKLKLHRNTIYKWGERPPGYVIAYLKLYIGIKTLAEKIK